MRRNSSRVRLSFYAHPNKGGPGFLRRSDGAPPDHSRRAHPTDPKKGSVDQAGAAIEGETWLGAIRRCRVQREARWRAHIDCQRYAIGIPVADQSERIYRCRIVKKFAV